jgi:DNA-binding SARP family transcriptional activator
MLGPLRVERRGEPLRLGGRQQRAVLAALLIEANHVVSLDRLADALWGQRVPNGSVTTIQTYISHLREVLEPDRPRGDLGQRLLTEAGGYRLRVEESAIDAVVFEKRVRTGCALLDAGRSAEASAAPSDALAMWRGAVLAELADYDFAQLATTPLEELRLTAVEARVEADLARGRHREVVGELEKLVTAHPLRERLHGQRMLALYRSGQQADALDAYRRVRETLADELGIDPSPPLQRLHQAILAQDEILDWHPPVSLPVEEDDGRGTPVSAAAGPEPARDSPRA